MADHPLETNIIQLQSAAGGRVRIARHGAQVVGWTDMTGHERLYLSARARAGAGEAIRGGIPVIFPQFGTGPLPKHGFVRSRDWVVVSQHANFATFRTQHDDATRTVWPHPYSLTLTVELTDRLEVRMEVTNPGPSPFTFTAALHNYFAVDDVGRASVRGLAGVPYHDKITGEDAVGDTRSLTIAGETDRVYAGGPRLVTIDDAVGSSSVTIEQNGFGDWVVWNPWRDGAAALRDMETDDYQRMLCVEAACVATPVSLAAGQTWTGVERISVS